MRILIALIFLLATGSPSHAQERAEGALISVVSGNWDGDEYPDALALIEGAEMTGDLIVYQGGFRGLNEVARLRAVVSTSNLLGAAPGLIADESGHVLLTSEQTGFGRMPWWQTLTLAWQDGGFVVTGYARTWYDRLADETWGGCYVNLVSGHWVRWLKDGPGTPEQRWHGSSAPTAFPLALLPGGFSHDACSPAGSMQSDRDATRFR